MAGDRSLNARFWDGTGRSRRRHDAVSARVVGAALTANWNDRLRPSPAATERQRRTISAWGPTAQEHLARLRIGVVGAGSVGALVAEVLARTGISELVLIDFDSVKLHNLDRLLHATATDVRLARSKVDVLARGLRRSATAAKPTIEARAQRGRGPGVVGRARLRRDLLLR